MFRSVHAAASPSESCARSRVAPICCSSCSSSAWSSPRRRRCGTTRQRARAVAPRMTDRCDSTGRPMTGVGGQPGRGRRPSTALLVRTAGFVALAAAVVTGGLIALDAAAVRPRLPRPGAEARVGGLRQRPARERRDRRAAALVLRRSRGHDGRLRGGRGVRGAHPAGLDRRGRRRPPRRVPAGAADAFHGRLQLRRRRPAGRALPPRSRTLVPPAARRHDAVYVFVHWRHAVTDYGPLFTLGARPLGRVSVADALWAFKAARGALQPRLHGADRLDRPPARRLGRRAPSPRSASTRSCSCGPWRARTTTC